MAVVASLATLSVESSAAQADEPPRWHGRAQFDLASGLTIRDDRGAVGQTEGTAVALAYRFDAGYRGAVGPHVLTLAFSSSQGLSFAPVAGALVKMVDEMRLRAGYELVIHPIVRPFTEVAFDAPLFATEEVRGRDTTFSVIRPDGSISKSFGKRIALAGPFRPLWVRESVGARFRPVRLPVFSLRVDGGLGAAHVVADGQLALEDKGTTSEVETIETQTSHSVGPEIALAMAGHFEGTRFAYAFETRARVPFASSRVRVADGLRGFERIDLEVRGEMSLRFVSWLTLDYGLVVLRRPLLIDRLELMNTLMLSVRSSGTGIVVSDNR